MATNPQASKSADASPQQAAQGPTFRYVDLPDLAETFADSIESAFFDGQSLRIEFCVGRLDLTKPQAAPTGRRYPTCRLVLSPSAAIDLMNRMQQISAALVKAGVLKPTPIQTTPSTTS
jgi:hypothetical protein